MLPLWCTCLSMGILAYSLCLSFNYSFIYVLFIAYLPSYFDGSECTGCRYWPSVATYYIAYLFPKNSILIYDTPILTKTQYIITSHPHGIFSAHHGRLLFNQTTPPFHTAFPGHNRRHLGASVVFRIPIWRDILLWGGCIDARKAYAVKSLSAGQNVMILPGGIAEVCLFF